MFVKTGEESGKITLKYAIEMASMDPPFKDRTLESRRLRSLKANIDRGQLLTFKWATGRIKGMKKADGKWLWYRVNGQHSSYLLATGMCSVEGCSYFLEEYECDTVEDLRALWSQFDPAFSSRTKANILTSGFSSDTEMEKLPRKQCTLAANALAVEKGGQHYASNDVQNYDISKLALDNKDFVIWACKMFNDKKCFRAGVVFAALLCYRENKDAASVFWTEVQTGSNPDPLSGSRALQKILFENSGKEGTKAGSKVLRWEQFVELSMAAWHAWKSNRGMKTLRLSKMGLEKYWVFKPIF